MFLFFSVIRTMNVRLLGELRRFLGRVSAVVLLAGLSACAGSERPQPAPLAPVLPLLGVRPAWSSEIGVVDFPLSVRVIGSVAYLADSTGTVAAIDGNTGKDLWRTNLRTTLSAGVGSDGRYSAVVSRDNELMVLDKGQLIWHQHLPALTLTAPLVAGARVFTLSADRTVTAFDAGNGRQLWQQTRPGDSLVLGQSGLLAAVGDTLVAGAAGRVIALNPSNGATLWELPIATARGTNEVERLADVVSGYARDGDQICVRSFQYTVTCLDAKAGKIVWSKPANGGTGVSADSTAVFSTESDGRIVSFLKQDGTKRWQFDGLRFRTLSAPLVVGKAVIVGDDAGNLHFISTIDAQPLNRMRTDGSALAVTPVMAGKTLLVVSRNGGIFAFRSE